MKEIKNKIFGGAARLGKAALVMMLVSVGVCALAQTPADTAVSDFKWAVGDTVVIKRGNTHYLTGERMSSWVYYVSFPIRQIGTKRFPDGVLLNGIMSWIAPDGIILKGAVAREDSVEQVVVQQRIEVSKQTLNQLAEEVANMSLEEQRKIEQQAKLYGAEVLRKSAEPQKKDTVPVVQKDTLPVEPQPQEPVVVEPQEQETPADTALAQPIRENYQRFSIGLRGGYANMLHSLNRDSKRPGGFDAMLDLQYAYYWTKQERPVDLGILTGLSLGYAQSSISMDINDSYTVTTDEGAVDYTLTADKVSSCDRQLQLEIPVMFSLITDKGLFFNIGPKLLLPLYTPYQQTITSPTVDAYFQEEGVHVTNEAITGRLENDQLNDKGKNHNQWKVNLLLTAEIGYEWSLRNGDALGLGVYANYSVVSAFKAETANKSLINVTPPSGDSKASASVVSATDTYVNKLGYVDVGIKVAYHFNFPKQKRSVAEK